MTDQNKIWLLMSRKLSGEASAEEISTFNTLLNNDPEIQQQYECMLALWESHGNNQQDQLINHDNIINRLNTTTDDENLLMFEQHILNRKKRNRFNWIIAASVAGIGFVLMLNFGVFKTSAPLATKIIEAPNGSRIRSQLPDGSVVFLNAGSFLTFNQFSDTLREVTLVGEGYFDIVRDETRPFLVHADNIAINVLGTRFTVRSFSEDNMVEATLLHGEVELKRIGESMLPIRLKPNQKIFVSKNIQQDKKQISGSNTNTLTVIEKDYYISSIDSTLTKTDLTETAWIYNRLVFRAENFELLAKKIERWFDVTIVFTNDQLKTLRFTGSFENETIDQALQALQLAESFNYKIHNNEIFISSP